MDEVHSNILKQVKSIQGEYQQKQLETNVLQNQNDRLLSDTNKYKQELILLANQHQFVCDNLKFEKQRSEQFQFQLNEVRNELQIASERLYENTQNYQIKLLESDQKCKSQERHYQNITKMYKQLKRDVCEIQKAKQ